MKIEEILNDNENKILFLKAILLGIKYGKSNNSDSYKQNIENEIILLNKEYNEIKNNLNNSIQMKEQIKEELKEEVKNEVNPEIKYVNNNENKFNYIIRNLTRNIIELENVKNNIMININNLSYNNYNTNYSKINSLRNNLNKITNEIENKRINLLKLIDDKNLNNSKINNFKTKNKIFNNKSKKSTKDYVTISN